MKNIISLILLAILTIGNIWAIIFVHIPILRNGNNNLSWIGIGVSIGAIFLGGMQLERLLYILAN